MPSRRSAACAQGWPCGGERGRHHTSVGRAASGVRGSAHAKYPTPHLQQVEQPHAAGEEAAGRGRRRAARRLRPHRIYCEPALRRQLTLRAFRRRGGRRRQRAGRRRPDPPQR
eukprot:482725-Prymnesium_polylepis.1